MAYSEKILRLATEKIAERRLKAENNAALRHDKIVKLYPEIAKSEEKMRQSAYSLINVIGMGDKAAEYIEKLKTENLASQSKIREILTSAGYAEDYLEPKYTCSLCEDTGFKNGRICTCHLELLKQLSYESLCKDSPLKLSKFSDFDLSYYKYDANVYDLMEVNYNFCVNFANSFDLTSTSIVMWGETGLGKTHLSLSIAGEVLKKGFGVIYGSVQNLFSGIEREHFGKADNADGTTEKMLLECDLLILDDLGAEFTTTFTNAILYNVINTRLLTSKPTIISTNLSLTQIEERYSRRIASRIIGEYTILTFDGRDVRQRKN